MAITPTTYYITNILGLITSATPHLALFVGNPQSGGTEVTGGSYARKPITFGSVTGGAIKNSVAISFTGMPTTTPNYYAIYNHLTAGNLQGSGLLNAEVALLAGDTVEFPINNIEVNVTGA